MMLVLGACGARLTSTQRLAGIGALGGGGTDTGSGGGSGNGTAGGSGSGTGAGGPGTNAGGPGGGGGTTATLPPGGNGGATDIGVTGNQITLAVASDVTGVQAALFKSTWQAMFAAAAYVNSTGGIYGRGIKILPLDTKADSTANRAAVEDACSKSFALVGSMSAFDNGGAEAGQQCGIPDISAITVNGSRALATNVYPAYPIRPDKLAIGTANYIKDTYGPAVIQNAAMLYLNAGVTKANALQRVKGYQSVGFKFTYIQEVQVLEANYSPFVQDMKDKGIRYVSMVANYQSVIRLLKAMDQAGWFPTVRDWDSVAYAPAFPQAGSPTDGSLVFLNTNTVEEKASNPEMQLYIYWLNRVAPGAQPDYFGFYAWSAGRLFQKVATDAGAKLTRKALFEAIKKVHSWDDYGMHAAHDTGDKIMSPCFLYLEVKGGKFVRKHPSSGFECGKGGIVNT
jgi:ABC-type branched-subunit amino acid transport system substrate-binding protein